LIGGIQVEVDKSYRVFYMEAGDETNDKSSSEKTSNYKIWPILDKHTKLKLKKKEINS
jgi:hypothetical protein